MLFDRDEDGVLSFQELQVNYCILFSVESKKSWPILYSKLPYKMDQDFLNIKY